MKKTILIILLLLCTTFIFAQREVWQWAKKAGGSNADQGHSIVTDSSGNSYVTGYFRETASFGSTTLESSGDADIFVAKLDSSGNWLWARQAGGTSNDYGYSIAIDSSGNSYVTGYFYGTASFGDSTLTNSGNQDIFVAKLDSSGNWLWAKKAGGTSTDRGLSIAIDSSGNSYVIGYFYETAYFGGSTLTNSGNQDIFVAKLDNNGNWLWAKKAGGGITDYGNSIAIDSSGNSYITGYFQGTASFGKTTLTSGGDDDIFVAKLGSDGTWQWAKQAGGTSDDRGQSIATDSSGNSYVTGYFTGTATFGNTTLTSSGGYDIFLAKLDNNGNWLWVQRAGGTSDDRGNSIAIYSSGNTFLTGYFKETAYFGSISLTSNNNNQDIFIAKVHIPYFPEDVFVEEENTGLRIKVSGGDADIGNLDNFPNIPNQPNSYQKLNLILHTSVSSWNINIQTDDTYGAYYLNNQWNVVPGNGTQIVFTIVLSKTKGVDIGIPIIVGNENPLPIELSSFTAYVNPQNNINILWITQTETGMSGFYVIRSTKNELSTAEVISPLIYATNTSEPKTYLYTDTELTESGTYYYWLQCNDLDGTFKIFGSISIDYNPTGGSTTPSILVTELQPVYPNPFNPQLFIPFSLADKAEVKFIIYNTRGQIVKTFDLGTQEKGHHRITWDGRDNDGSLCGNGIYYLAMKAGNSGFRRKSVLMK